MNKSAGWRVIRSGLVDSLCGAVCAACHWRAWEVEGQHRRLSSTWDSKGLQHELRIWFSHLTMRVSLHNAHTAVELAKVRSAAAHLRSVVFCVPDNRRHRASKAARRHCMASHRSQVPAFLLTGEP
mmetsp:Transcript_12410/g.34170  ORF Transcript_12410/g.34170 Transcript_12410/m.34170 type:complete len:126 (-) Transcript_12410:166-543(-)